MGYILILLSTGLGVCNTILNKRFQLSVRNTLTTFTVYNLLNALFACAYFYIYCGFRITMNFTTLCYALGYALIVINSLIANMVALSYVAIPVYTITSTAGSIVGATAFGRVMFDEPITVMSAISVVLIIAAITVPAVKQRWIMPVTKQSLWACIWVFLCGFVGSPFLKLYVTDSRVLDSRYLFFATNFVVMIIAILIIIGIVLKNGRIKAGVKALAVFKAKDVLNIGARTAISNVNSVISAMIAVHMAVSVSTVISSSLSIIASILISGYVFRERLSIHNYISVILAVLAVIARGI